MKTMDILKHFQDRNDKRSTLIYKNILASLVIKGWSVLVQLMLVPTTLACLGVYENGVWLTISSVLLWIDNFDVGLGNGLRNKLAEAIAVNDLTRARVLVSSTFAMLAIIMLPVLLFILLFVTFADNYLLFNVDRSVVSRLDTVLIVSSIMVCTTFVFKFIGNVFMGLQLPAANNLLVASGNTLAFLSTFCVYVSGIHSLFLVALANTASQLLVYLACYPIVFFGRYSFLRPSFRLVKLSAARVLFSTGGRFFVLQMSGIVLFFSSNIIISYLYSPSMVTPFHIAQRYFMVAMMLFHIVGVPFWSATTDAYVRKDFCWIRKSNSTLNRLLLCLAMLFILMILLSDLFYKVWIGGNAEVPFSMTVLVGIYQFILIWSSRYSYVLNGFGHLDLQVIVSISASVSYVILAYMTGVFNVDINWLLLLMCLVNIPGLVVNYVQYNKIVNGKAKGIWKR